MTGFATKSLLITTPMGKKSTVTVSIKSLNSRFFEMNCKMPQPFLHLETGLVSLVKEKLQRGHVYLVVHCSDPDVFQGPINPALETARAYIAALKTIRAENNIAEEVTLGHIVKLPNLFNTQEQTIDAAIKDQFFALIAQALEQLVAERNTEGKKLATDIFARLAIIDREFREIQKQIPLVVERYKTQIDQALQEAKLTESETPKNVLYLLLDKIDIHEEVIRFASHFANINTTLQDATIEKGKRLDFTFQELMREANTMNAKCSDAQVSSHVISIKVEVEKMREQIQNIV